MITVSSIKKPPKSRIDFLRTWEIEPCSDLTLYAQARNQHIQKLASELYGSSPSQEFSQSLQNVLEMVTIFNQGCADLFATRQALPKTHDEGEGIDSLGQFLIYKYTLNVSYSLYSLISYVAGFSNLDRGVLEKAKPRDLGLFFDNLGRSGFPLLGPEGPIRRAYDFRSLAVHQNDKLPMNWDTLSRDGSEIFVVLRGLGEVKQPSAQECDFQEGAGWVLAFPNENFLQIIVLDLVIHQIQSIVTTVLKKRKSANRDIEFLKILAGNEIFDRVVNRAFDDDSLNRLLRGRRFYLNED